MKGFRKFLFVLCFVVCIISLLGLILFSIFASYKGSGDDFPSLYGILITNNDGFVKAFSCYLFNSLPYGVESFGFLSQAVFGVLLIVFLASPLLLIASIVLVIYYFVQALKYKITGNMTLALTTTFVISTQSLHVFLLCSGLKQSYFSEIRSICVIVAILGVIVLSEIVPQAKYESKISITNKIYKFSILVIAFYLLNQIMQSCSQNTFAWFGIFAFFAIELIAHILFSSLYVLTRYSIAISLVNSLVVSGLFITLKFFSGANDVTFLTSFILPLVLWIILSISYVYVFNKLCIIYGDPIYIDRKMSGFGNNREVNPRKINKQPFDWRAFIYPLKVLFGIVIVALSMILSNFLLKLIIGLVIKSEEWLNILSNVGSVAFSGYIIYLLYEGYGYFPFDWKYFPECGYIDSWKLKNATSCLVFINTILTFMIAAFTCPLILLEVAWLPNLANARWTYLLILIIVFIITRMIEVNKVVSEYTCARCHYIDSYQSISSWKGKATLQRHKKKVEGHYVTDVSRSSTTYETTTRGSSDIHMTGHGQIGYTLDKGTSTTTGTTHTTTQRWVDGYEVDEGLYEHQTRYTKNRCACCGYTYTSSHESSHLVG